MTTEIDPRDPDAVATAVASWASTRFGSAVTVATDPTAISGGFDSFIHRVELVGDALPAEWTRPVVVRVLPSPGRAPLANREAAVQSWCREHGFPAPAVLAVLSPDDGLGRPAQIMELAPGSTMLAAVTARPWRAMGLVDRLAGLARHLHALPIDGFPGPVWAERLVDQRLRLPRLVVTELQVPALAGALTHAEAAADAAMTGPAVVCHGDFHPLNVIVDGPSSSVIDWTDAGLGPREADVARTLLLFHLAAIAADGAVERAALRIAGPRLARRYRRAYAAGVGLDPALLRRWELLHAVHGWAQVEMLRAGGFEGASSASPDAVPDDVARFLQARVEALTAAG